MHYFQLFFFSIILVLVELLLIPLPFFFLSVLLWSIYVAEDQAFIQAFIIGIIYDILLLRPIGYTSTLFLLLLFVATAYKRTLQSNNILFLVFWSFVSSIIIIYFNTHIVSFGAAALIALITFLLVHRA